jgi:hypothetical protein
MSQNERIPESCDLEAITPEIARNYLAANTRNYRAINATIVDRYARSMTEGRWEERHHDGIAFDWDGALGNGQHRLAAIVKSGKTVVMWVHRGCNPDIFLHSDSGLRRTEADRLRQLGFRSDVDVRLAASVARFMLLGLRGGETTGLVSAYSLRHESLIGTFILELARSRPRRAEIIAAFCKATFDYDESHVLECAKRYASLNFEGNDDPLHLLVVRLVEGVGTRRMRHAPIYAYAVTAIRAAVEGRRLQRLLAAERDFGEGTESQVPPAPPPPPSRNGTVNGHVKETRPKFPARGF